MNEAGHEFGSADGVVSEERDGRGNVEKRLALRNVGFRRVLDVQMEKILAHRVELAVNQNSKNDRRVFTVAANCVTK